MEKTKFIVVYWSENQCYQNFECFETLENAEKYAEYKKSNFYKVLIARKIGE